MIYLVTGVPGSGKTYFVVHQIYDLITSKEKKYKNIYTNINGFNYSLANKLAGVDDYVKPFEFSVLRDEMQKEYEYHQLSKDTVISLKFDFVPLSDDDYNQLNTFEKQEYDERFKEYKKSLVLKSLKTNYDSFVKKQGVYKDFIGSLIIVDECHLYFESKEDPVLVRFLSYHRHFNIDMFIITQNKNLINKKYLSFIESMFVAYPASKRLFSKVFRYKKFASYQEYKSNIIGNTSLKLDEKVFKLYSSGSNEIGKSVVGKMILPIFLVVLFAYALYSYLTSTFEGKSKKHIRHFDNNDTNKSKVVKHFDDSSDLSSKLYKVDCFVDSCIFNDSSTSFKKDVLMKLIAHYKCKIVLNNVTDVNYQTYFFNCDSNLQEFLNFYKSKKDYNEKGVNSHSLITKPLGI